MIAPGERPRVSLRISVTDRCELRCLYCRPDRGGRFGPRSAILSYEEIVQFVRAVGGAFEIEKFRLTGGEPLGRTDVTRLAARLAAENVKDLAVTTNGRRLAGLAGGLARAGVRRVNVSLDSLDAATYRAITRGGEIAPVLAGIDAALRAGLAPVKLNAVVLRGCNDGEVARLARFGLDRGCEVRFLELMPIGPARARFGELFVPTAETRARLEAAGLSLAPRAETRGASSRDFDVVESGRVAGRVGFIAPVTNSFCGGCRRLRLTSAGRLIGCLARGEGPDVRALCAPGREAELREAVRAQLAAKRGRPVFETARLMVAVGG